MREVYNHPECNQNCIHWKRESLISRHFFLFSSPHFTQQSICTGSNCTATITEVTTTLRRVVNNSTAISTRQDIDFIADIIGSTADSNSTNVNDTRLVRSSELFFFMLNEHAIIVKVLKEECHKMDLIFIVSLMIIF